MALCEPATTELKSKKRSRTITDLSRSLYTDPFFDLNFDFRLIWSVSWQDNQNEKWKMKNEELSASPIKKQRSAAEGKANYRIKKQRSTSDRKATVKTLE